MKNLWYGLMLGLSVVSLPACEQEGPAEKAGEQIDQAVEKAGEQIEEAGDKMREATDR